MSDLEQRLRDYSVKERPLREEAADRLRQYREENERLRNALKPFAAPEVILPTGVIVGLERHHFTAARTALKETTDAD